MTDSAPVSSRQRRALLVTNVPNPYRLPLFEELSRQLGERGVHLRVLFGAAGYRRRLWSVDLDAAQFDHGVLSSQTFEVGGDAEKTVFTYGGLLRQLRAYDPDVAVVTGFSLATVKIWLYSLARRLPYVIWAGSVDGVWTGKAQGRTARSTLRTLQRRVLAGGAAAFVAYGSKAREYLVGLGAPPESVHVGINTVDTRFFAEETERAREERGESGGRVRFTSIGYLSPRKGTLKLLRAVRDVAGRRRDFVLDVIGDGEDRPALEAFVRENGLEGVVQFHGYQQREALPAHLARSRALLFATDYDIWGLVLVEAMAAGLPAVASTRAGATYDLVCEGETGFAVDFDDTDRLASIIERLLDDPEEAAAMGRRAQAFVAERVTLERSATGFVAAVRQALAGRLPAAGAPRQPVFSPAAP